MSIDLTTPHGITHEVKAAPLFSCPYCGAPVRPSMLVAYPAAAVAQYTPIYRCGGRNHSGCGRYIGALIVDIGNSSML